MAEQTRPKKPTPKGTNPCPTRRSTKHKRPAYGEWLQERHQDRKVRRAARP